MNIVLLHDEIRSDAREDERDALVQAEVIGAALTRLGHTSECLPFSLNLRQVADELKRRRPDLVFNLVESVEGQGRLLPLATALLDSLGIPYTGSHNVAMVLTTSKTAAKQLMAASGLPTAPYLSLTAGGEPGGDAGSLLLPGRFVIKPVWEEASVGIDDDSVVEAGDLAALRSALADRAARLGEVFAEPYIDGREFNLSILAGPDGPEVLPPAEIHFVGYAPDRPKMVGWRAKWDASSYEFHHTPRSFDFPATDEPLLVELRRLCRECWRRFDLRGYVRVDFRVDPDGRPWILEINANPCLSPDAGFAAAADRAGLTFESVVERILADALRAAASAKTSTGHGRTGFAMPAGMTTRHDVRPSDVPAVRDLVAATGFFHHHEIDVAVELVQENLARGAAASGYHFLFTENEGRLVGYSCYGPIACAVGSYDLFWIVVHPSMQGRGLGRALLAATEEQIAADGGRRVYAETSGRPQYAPTRRFYERCGYVAEARLPEFYAPGDDKVVYVKVLAGRP